MILSSTRAADHQRREPLELPRRLGRLADEREALAARHGGVPLLLLVDDDRVRREAEQADDLGVVGRAEEDDGVALVDELHQLTLFGDDPRARAVDDLEAALFGALEHVRPDSVGPDDDSGAVVDIIERVDGLDAEVTKLAYDAIVVDHLAQRVRGLAGRGRLLGLVDRLANAIAEARAVGDADLLDGSHASIIARGPVPTLRRRRAGRAATAPRCAA